MNDKKGYTLIELILVLAMLAILAMVIMPNLNMDYGYLDKTANELVMDLRYVQNKQMQNPKSTYCLYIGANNDNYQIWIKPMPIDDSDKEKKVTLKEGYTINTNDEDSKITFSPNGAPSSGGCTITLTDTKRNKIKKITIVPATGRTVITE